MKKTHLLTLTTFLLLLFAVPVQAQRGFIRNQVKKKVRKEMKEKYAEPQKEKGRKAIRDNVYENDTRYPVPENPVTATMVMETKNFKKNGKLKETSTMKMLFGKTGECMIMNEGEEEESRILFDYKGASTYMINTKEKTATKMPMINFQKLGKKLAGDQMDLDDDNGEWIRTEDQKEINGYTCRKYVYTNMKEKMKMYAWVTQDISIDLTGNHLFGGQIIDFSTNSANTSSVKRNKNYPNGMMVRSVYFEKNRDTPSMQMDITSFTEKSDSRYFDLSDYKVTDVLGGL
ncbi:DUF4412 domain-containing protein [Mesonia ostreae]|uniref:DUF4412 domain-containing protein n=1 Tax=Mesonia ostreae TaxID=861110 RepID=A0ABU2KIU7_9FLAO|nr:DUF4412 domain-containing protein [Mesonia ostreae]MDT0294604.1 DUF4412 domain-containing protein [Mesonia ostreae]